MRTITLPFDIPESKADCDKTDCSMCDLMMSYLLDDKAFTCWNPTKACKVWRVQ
jgi:hypothetical protein